MNGDSGTPSGVPWKGSKTGKFCTCGPASSPRKDRPNRPRTATALQKPRKKRTVVADGRADSRTVGRSDRPPGPSAKMARNPRNRELADGSDGRMRGRGKPPARIIPSSKPTAGGPGNDP